MNTGDERFFEALASGESSDSQEAPEIELARADASALASRTRSAATGSRERSASRPAEAESSEGQLTVDVYQTPSDIFVESAIAGVRPEDIDVSVTPDSVAIHGTREQEIREEGKDYIYQECYWGRFGRSIILPQEIDPEGADVKFKNGILTVRLPKANKRKTRKLNVRVE